MNIYVASSWRNQSHPQVVMALRLFGHDVYNFRNPTPATGNIGFHWADIDAAWQTWTVDKYRSALDHPLARHGFANDFKAMQWADTFVGVMPFGRSASFEMGWAAGQGKRTLLLLSDGEPELMVKMFDALCGTLEEVRIQLEAWAEIPDGPVVVDSEEES